MSYWATLTRPRVSAIRATAVYAVSMSLRFQRQITGAVSLTSAQVCVSMTFASSRRSSEPSTPSISILIGTPFTALPSRSETIASSSPVVSGLPRNPT